MSSTGSAHSIAQRISIREVLAAPIMGKAGLDQWREYQAGDFAWRKPVHFVTGEQQLFPEVLPPSRGNKKESASEAAQKLADEHKGDRLSELDAAAAGLKSMTEKERALAKWAKYRLRQLAPQSARKRRTGARQTKVTKNSKIKEAEAAGVPVEGDSDTDSQSDDAPDEYDPYEK